MATTTCPNGHRYDSNIYGSNCPFCPSQEGRTRVADGGTNPTRKVESGIASDFGDTPTIPMQNQPTGGHTIIRQRGSATSNITQDRRMVGLLISFSRNPAGEVFKVYEGRTTIGRDSACDISFPEDSNMSANHLLIQYVEAKGAFRAQEYGQGSANGTYVNGQVYVLGDVIDLKNNDVIILGSTKFVFLTIPSIIFNSPEVQL